MTDAATSRDVVSLARDVAPHLDARAAEGERLRTMPADLVEELKTTGVFKLHLPRSLGGVECEPVAAVEAIETLSHADGSGGWTAMIGNTTMFTAWLDPGVASEIFSPDPDLVMAGLFAPAGTATPDGDDLLVDGRWAFNSGCPHSAWLCLGVMVMDGDGPRTVPPGRPDWRFAFLPASDAEVLDTWDAAGLRGTGSHDVIVSGARVPQQRTCIPFFDPVRHDGPLYRIPFWNLLMVLMAGWPLGVGRRALDEFTELARRKSRSADGSSLANDPMIQVELAQADASLRAARAFVVDAVGDAWTTVTAGDDLSTTQRSRITAATLNALRAAISATDFAFHRAGGGALYASSPLQRCFRDIHAGSQHIAFSIESWRRVGKVALDVEQPTFMI